MSGAHRAPPPGHLGWRIVGRVVVGLLTAVALVAAGYCFVLAYFAMSH